MAPSIFRIWLHAATVSFFIIEVSIILNILVVLTFLSLTISANAAYLISPTSLTLLSQTPAPCEAPILPVPSVSIIEER